VTSGEEKVKPTALFLILDPNLTLGSQSSHSTPHLRNLSPACPPWPKGLVADSRHCRRVEWICQAANANNRKDSL